MKIRTAAFTASVALALAVSGYVNVGTAHAAIRDCPSGNFCLYANDNFSGAPIAKLTGATPNVGSAVNDRARSVYNNSRLKWCIYEQDDFKTGFDSFVQNKGGNVSPKTTSARPCK